MFERCTTILKYSVLAFVTVFFGSSFESPLLGQEFRIESQVYNDESKLPVSENITMFSQDLVYDFCMSNEAQPKPVEVVIYNSRQRRIILLDPARKIRMELADLSLHRIVDGVRRATVQDNRTRFLVEDKFEEHTDFSTNWVTMESPNIIYRFRGEQPKDVSIMPKYFEFLEVFTRLGVTDPTKIPPFPRMKLNQSIRRLGWLPSEVQISVNQNSLFRESFTAKSKHTIIKQLSSKDRERITLAKQQWQTFKKVPFEEYRGLKRSTKPSNSQIGTVSYDEPVKDK